MIKPEWRNAPKWANYLAMDANGKWFWFENEPTITEGEEIYRPNFGKSELAVHWTESTESRP